MQVDEKVLARTIERFRERKILLPTFAQMRDPATRAGEDQAAAQERRPVGCRSGQPVSHHVEERAGRARRAVQPGQLDRVSAGAHRRRRADHRPRRQVLSDRRAQGRRRVRLPRAEARQRPVRSDAAESRLAEHGQLLPRRRVRFGARRLHGRRDPARGNEPRAIRVAQGDRRRSDPHARLRIERQRNLRQVLGNPPHAARLRDLQSVRRVRQRRRGTTT